MSEVTASLHVSIQRIKFQSVDDLLSVMRTQAEDAVPLIIEGTGVMDSAKWADLAHLGKLLQGKEMLVKRSPTHKFRYFDLRKNTGGFPFSAPVEELHMPLEAFLAEAEQILAEGRPERLYLQETLSGHAEMADEFASWRWELLIRVSSACGWGLPDSNELFIGMQGAETPLHFDERENLFFQVRGRKELLCFPFVDYTRLYPFPTTHACDRQSMVGDPWHPDLEAFPRFRGLVGHQATLQAGDLVYLPYGWWHWLRNLDAFAVSVSFWSTTPPSDLSGGIPTSFSPHMLTRVRRNLESMIAQASGPERHDATMLQLRDAVLKAREDREARKPGDPGELGGEAAAAPAAAAPGAAEDPLLTGVRRMLAAVKVPPAEQDAFLLEMIEGRFGIDWSRHV